MARPKLTDGEKGNYNVSRKEKAKRSLKRSINHQKRERDRLQTKAKNRTGKKKKAEKALDILDRTGVSKRQEISTESKVIHGIVLLPAKKEQQEIWLDQD